MSQSAFQKAVEDFFGYFDRNGDGEVTINEAKEIMRVALKARLGMDVEVDEKKLEADVDRQVKGLLSKADFDHDKKISLAEFQKYYQSMLHQGMEPEVLLLDMKRVIKVLKDHNINRSPNLTPKASSNSSTAAGLCIIRLCKKSQGSNPGHVAGRLRMELSLSLVKGVEVSIKGKLKSLPSNAKFTMSCELKDAKVDLGLIETDVNGSSTVSLDNEFPAKTTMKVLANANFQLSCSDTRKRIASVQVLELHK
ncbi:hypothetical protein AAMO2058_001682800 [Amorphochlora amoebiformis]